MRRWGRTRIIVLALLLLIAAGLGLFIAGSMGKPDNRAVVGGNQAVINPPTMTAALTATFNAPFATERSSLHATWDTGTATWQAAGFAAGATTEAGKAQAERDQATQEAALRTEFAPTRAVMMQTETAIARTPEALRPTPIPFPTQVPEPTATPIMGIYPAEYPGAYGYYPSEAWQGIVDGKLGGVVIGNGRGDGPYLGGSLLVVYKGNGWMGNETEFYATPRIVGALKIKSVEGTRVTIVSTDGCFAPATFVFDLKTRQWVEPPEPSPTPQMGIAAEGKVCARGRDILVTNGWRGQINGKFITVAAGAGSWDDYYKYSVPLDSSDSQGMVFVQEGTDLLFDNILAGIRTPFRVGPVHIMSVKGNILTVADKDNSTTFLFDLNKSQFISPPGMGSQIPIGFLGQCNQAGNYKANLDYCWRGVIKGKFISVATTSDYPPAIDVFDGPDFSKSDANPRVYPEPSGVSATYLGSIAGNMFFSKDDKSPGDNITFDITTGRFAIDSP